MISLKEDNNWGSDISEVFDIAIQAIEKVQQIESISTIEEFKALKENSFFNFDSPVVRVDKKSYDKAIDEFAELLRPLLNTYHDQVRIDEIAERMKGAVR